MRHIESEPHLMSQDQVDAFNRALEDREQLENNLEALLDRLAFVKRGCNLCDVQIRLIKFLKPGNEELSTIAVNFDGSLHEKTCAKRKGACA
jgi:hypothetical protein